MVGKVAMVALSTIVHILPLRKHYQQNANYFLFFLHFSYKSLHYCQKSITFTAEKSEDIGCAVAKGRGKADDTGYNNLHTTSIRRPNKLLSNMNKQTAEDNEIRAS